MRYRIANLGRRRLGDLMRVDQLWLKYGLLQPPAGFETQWRTCNTKVLALAPAYDSSSPQGQDAIACINALMVSMGRSSEIIDMTPIPPPGTCTDLGVRIVQEQGGYQALTCPTGPDCHNVIDAATGKVLIRDIKGAVGDNPVCAKWGFGSGSGSASGGGGTSPGGGSDPGTWGLPIIPDTPGGGRLPAAPPAASSTAAPEEEEKPGKVDKSALVGAGAAGILAVFLALSKSL